MTNVANIKFSTNRLRELVEDNGHNQSKVARILGFTRQRFNKIIVGKSQPNGSDLIKFCKFFKVEPDFFTEDM